MRDDVCIFGVAGVVGVLQVCFQGTVYLYLIRTAFVSITVSYTII